MSKKPHPGPPPAAAPPAHDSLEDSEPVTVRGASSSDLAPALATATPITLPRPAAGYRPHSGIRLDPSAPATLLDAEPPVFPPDLQALLDGPRIPIDVNAPATLLDVVLPQIPEAAEPPKVSKSRFPPTIVDVAPPVHEPSPPPAEAAEAEEPQVAKPRFPATWIDLAPPTEQQHEIDSAPATVRKPSGQPPPAAESSPAMAPPPPSEPADYPSIPGAPLPPSVHRMLEEAAHAHSEPVRIDETSAATPSARKYPPSTPMPAPRATLPTVRPKGDARFFSRDDAGRWLDRYELITEIAAGGMATVFLARLAGAGGFQRLVAIKRLHTHLAEEPEFVEMFLEEARIAAQIHHAHAVPILEIGQSPRGFYLVMEYIEGVTLAQLASRVAQSELPLPRKIGLRLILDTLAGLHAAHELTDAEGKPMGVVHRDCSPQNVLVGVDGTARLTDFGVARATARLSNTKIGTLKGKVAYMAPEQIRQDPIDRRADLFAMGVILWEVLAGRPLFRAGTKFETIVNALNAPIPRLRDTVFGISEELDALCAKALARDPEDRFQTAVEMAEAIEQIARNSLATSREVASFLLKLFGRELNDRRTGIRSWLDEVPLVAPPITASTPPPPPEPILRAPVAVIDPSLPAAAADPHDLMDAPDSVTAPRQFVGSLAPIRFEEDSIELPMASPARGSLRKVGIVAAVAAVLIAVALLWAYLASSPSAPDPAPAPAATAAAATEVPAPTATAAPVETAAAGAPSAAGSAKPWGKLPGKSEPKAAAGGAEDDLKNPYAK